MEVVGRDEELARVATLVEPVQATANRLLLEGEPGIGKTTVWRAGVAAAESRGLRVLSARPAEAESSLSYAGLADLLAAVDESALEPLPDVQRAALEIALLRRDADGKPPDPRAVFTAFANTLGELAGESTLLLAIDDLQWLDGPTARAVAFANRRLAAHVRILASTRTDGEAAVARREWFEPHERLRLAPLSPAALHRLVADRLGWSMTRPSLLRLHRICDGNAFFALELARGLIAAGQPDAHGTWPVPDDVRTLVDVHLRTLPAPVRRALLLAAAASHPTAELLASEPLAEAEAAGVVSVANGGAITFTHPLYASAIYLGASAEQRRAAHAELAERASDVEERARHLGLATTAADEAVAVELDRAASRARSRGAPETAAELQLRAAELTPAVDREAAGRRSLAAADHWFHAGALARAAVVLTRLLDSDETPALRAHALLLLAYVRFRERSIPESIELLHAASAEAGDDPHVRARAELELTFASVSVSFDFDAAGPHAEATRHYAEQAGDRALVAEALAVTVMLDFLLGRGLDRAKLERSLELEVPDHDAAIEVHPTLIAGLLSFYVDDYDASRRHLYSLTRRLRDRGQDGDLPVLLAHTAWMECLSGRIEAAGELAEEAIELAALSESATMTANTLATAALHDAHAGNEASCRARVAESLEALERAGYGVSAHWAFTALGLLEVSLGNAAAARDAMAPLVELSEKLDVREPIRLTFLPDYAEALIELGELDRAQGVIDFHLALGREHDRASTLASAERARALLLAARGDTEGAHDALSAAFRHHERLPVTIDLARAHIVRGLLERRAKRKAAARDSLGRAVAICEQIGAASWAERARAELARIGLRGSGDELTATEERIAALAASGLTNREIAAAAFVTQKTVEANLSRIYRKLGIRSRAELGIRLAERRAPIA